jgi:redox-sensitive bicupin YhaK (pirin superfamily)
MSNTETHPSEQVIGDGVGAPTGGLEVLEPREVPLGGPRAMMVRRALPGKNRRMVGAWCFVDTYGPEDTRMVVPPHPHTGLQTVSWLVAGEVRHRDSLDSDVLIRPGQLNLMTAGAGIAHSEVSPSDATGPLHGVQLWVALPDGDRTVAPAFESHAELPRVRHDEADVTVLIGELLGARSPATTYTPIVGAEVALASGTSCAMPLRRDFEHGVLALTDGLAVDGTPVPTGHLAYAAPGTSSVHVAFDGGNGDERATALLLGGRPFEEALVMWWNFVGRSHDEIADARTTWQAEREAPEDERPRFGLVPGHDGFTLPAPELPNATLRARPRHRDS